MASKQYEAGSPAKPMKKSVKIVEDDVEVIGVGEKHGPLFNAIPRMPIPVAVVCCILNIFVPGLGTLISSFTVFCGFTSKVKNRMKAFLLNLLSAFLQMLTFLVILGWIWSILWGMNFIQIAMNADKKDKAMLTPYYCRRQSSVDVPIL